MTLPPPVPPPASAPASPEAPPPASAERFMREALAEARRGLGRTHPNPCVGAVVVWQGRVVGRGHHAQAGAPHAEVEALAQAGALARGADLYTTLEPCDHWGRTPPCSRAILDAGVAHVVSASADPNPLVNGKGLLRLREAGVRVTTGVLQAEADALNRPFFKAMRSGLPLVTLKAAVTLDGKLATASGHARWVSGEEARADAHRLRNLVDAVLVGAGTVRADNPQLTTRLEGGEGRNPLRVVLDTEGTLPLSAHLFHQPDTHRTVVLSAEDKATLSAARLGPTGARVWGLPRGPGGLQLKAALQRLAEEGALHLLVEGGARLFASLLAERLPDALVLYLAPKLLGADALSFIGPLGLREMGDAVHLEVEEVTRLGGDVRLQARFLWR
ncbi:MAG: bifunctional diaminohydroxyphosphoribosylaminopyrimidine deaminase/5-amino-6-(5-phosphoribosylamino)uracil reductase RibD [Myxococcaceae bacterium]